MAPGHRKCTTSPSHPAGLFAGASNPRPRAAPDKERKPSRAAIGGTPHSVQGPYWPLRCNLGRCVRNGPDPSPKRLHNAHTTCILTQNAIETRRGSGGPTARQGGRGCSGFFVSPQASSATIGPGHRTRGIRGLPREDLHWRFGPTEPMTSTRLRSSCTGLGTWASVCIGRRGTIIIRPSCCICYALWAGWQTLRKYRSRFGCASRESSRIRSLFGWFGKRLDRARKSDRYAGHY